MQGVLKSWLLVSLLNLQLLKFSSNSKRTVAKRVRSSLQTLKSEFFMPLTELGHRYSDRAFTNQAGYRVALESSFAYASSGVFFIGERRHWSHVPINGPLTSHQMAESRKTTLKTSFPFQL